MKKRLGVIGVMLVVAGFIFAIAGGVAYAKVQNGYDALQAFSEVQNVQLSYNDDGQLVDRGETAQAQEIMTMLTEDWQYPVVKSDFDPNDPLVNSASEYMYQMATVVFHVIHGTQTITLDEPVDFQGVTYAAGDPIEVPVDGRYWTDFDRSDPIQAEVREMAWTGTVHGLVGELGVGTVTHSTLQMGLALSGLFAGLGLLFIITGAGLFWVSRAKDFKVPDTIPESFVKEPITTPELV